jgi:hypothetical protein
VEAGRVRSRTVDGILAGEERMQGVGLLAGQKLREQ